MSEGKVKDTLVKFKNAILRLAEDGDSYRQKLSEVIENLHKKNEEMEKRMNDMQQNIQKLIAERKTARENKDWKKADGLRDQIIELGFEVKDTDKGQEIK